MIQSPHVGLLLHVKTSLLLGVLSMATLGRAAQEHAVPDSPAPDPICGFLSGPHSYQEAAQVKQGISVDLLVGRVVANQPVTLRFFVNERPKSLPVDPLQPEHEKLMHVIGVRDDLNEFFHIHPLRVAPGRWEIAHSFTQGGTYKIWTDLKYQGVSYSFALPRFQVEGVRTNNGPSKAEDSIFTGAYHIVLNHTQKAVMARTNLLQFDITDAADEAVEIENYLGSAMHLVAIKDDLSVYLHAHPEPRNSLKAPVRFHQVFPEEGTYKIYAQFRPRQARLPVDEAILCQFKLSVSRE